MNEIASGWLAEYQRADARIRQITDALTQAQANWKPAPKKWSVTQCMDHLFQSMDTYCAKMAPAIARAKSRGLAGVPPYGGGTFTGRFILNFLNKGITSKAPAPGVFKPSATEFELVAARGRLLDALARVQNLLAESDGLAMGKVVFATPVSVLIRVSLAQAFAIHAVHLHRHIDQMERVTRNPDFPKG